MSKHISTFWKWEGVIPPEKCQAIIQNHFQNTEDGKYQNHDGQYSTGEKRKTEISWVHPGTELFDLAFNYIKSANEQNWNFDLSGMEDMQLGRYEDGGHYEWHADIDDICDQGFQRKLSFSLQLTPEDEYEGGDLVIKNSDGQEFIAPRQQGSITIFSSLQPHKVTPVTSGVRYSAVGWMRGPAFR